MPLEQASVNIVPIALIFRFQLLQGRDGIELQDFNLTTVFLIALFVRLKANCLG